MITNFILFAAWSLAFAGRVHASSESRKDAKPKIHSPSSSAKPKASEKDTAEAEGVRSPESILRVVRQHIGGFRYTYEKFLRSHAGQSNKISLKFKIDAAGDIRSMDVVESTGSPELDQEIVDKARRMKFDQIEKGFVTVTYAFVLDQK